MAKYDSIQHQSGRKRKLRKSIWHRHCWQLVAGVRSVQSRALCFTFWFFSVDFGGSSATTGIHTFAACATNSLSVHFSQFISYDLALPPSPQFSPYSMSSWNVHSCTYVPLLSLYSCYVRLPIWSGYGCQRSYQVICMNHHDVCYFLHFTFPRTTHTCVVFDK